MLLSKIISNTPKKFCGLHIDLFYAIKELDYYINGLWYCVYRLSDNTKVVTLKGIIQNEK